MSKKDRRAIVILLFILFLIDVIIVVKFFTKDNSNRSTIKKADTYSVYEESALLDETVSEKIEEEVLENKENMTEEVVQTEKVNSEVNVKEKQVAVNNYKSETPTVSVAQNESNISSRAQTSRSASTTVSTQASGDELVSSYQGYATSGKIEIPKTGVNMPILSRQTVGGMEIAACLLFSTGKLNESGNTLIVGHNYRNGKLFSNNNRLQVGDKIYITTLDGNRVEYIIYNKFVTTPEDTSFLDRDTAGKPEITLSSCSDDNVSRIVILARTNN